MIRFRAFGIAFALPLPLLLMPLLAARLGLQAELGSIGIALCVHELAHLLAARLAQVAISEIQLLPFGGSARMENPYQIPAGRLIAVALAGPAANLLLIVICAALVQWRLLLAETTAPVVRTSLTLMLFNLLPALPLDGGRVLYALLQRPLGEARALRIGLWLGHGLALVMIAIAVAAGLRFGSWNLTLLLAAVFLLTSGRDESAALAGARARRMQDALDANGVRPVRIYQLDASTPARRALNLMRPRECAWFVLTKKGVPCGLVDGRSILQCLIDGDAPEAELGSLTVHRPPQPSPAGAPT